MTPDRPSHAAVDLAEAEAPSPTRFLARKLSAFVRLSAEDRAALDRLCAGRLRRYPARADLARQGEPPRAMRIVLDGWACRTRALEDGRQQVVGLLVSGDTCDLNVYILREMDHTITALTPVLVAEVTREAVEAAVAERPRLLEALWWEGLVSTAIQREWLVSLGARDAHERVMHLFCETFLRLQAAGQTEGWSCAFPLTQAVLADVMGLSVVHVNRTLQTLREEGLVELTDRTLSFPDFDAAVAAALLDPAYLHLEREGRHIDAWRPGAPVARPRRAGRRRATGVGRHDAR